MSVRRLPGGAYASIAIDRLTPIVAREDGLAEGRRGTAIDVVSADTGAVLMSFNAGTGRALFPFLATKPMGGWAVAYVTEDGENGPGHPALMLDTGIGLVYRAAGETHGVEPTAVVWDPPSQLWRWVFICRGHVFESFVDLDGGMSALVDRGPTPTSQGIHRLVGERVILNDENRFSVPGLLNPERAGDVVVGENSEGPDRAVGWMKDGPHQQRFSVLPGEARRPKIVQLGASYLISAIDAHGIRLETLPPFPEDIPAIAPIGRACWLAWFRFGGSPTPPPAGWSR